MTEVSEFYYVGALGAALIIALCAQVHAVVGPAWVEMRNLMGFVIQAEDVQERIKAQEHIEKLRELVRGQRRHIHVGQTFLDVGCLFSVFTLCLSSLPLAQALGACTVFGLLWVLSVSDRRSCWVLDADIFILALFSAWIVLLVPIARWTSLEMSMLGFALIGALILGLKTYFWIKERALQRYQGVHFGDGDVLVLFALSIFFGADVLMVLGLGSACFFVRHIAMYAWGKPSNAGQPFVPCLFWGGAATIALKAHAGWSLNPIASTILSAI